MALIIAIVIVIATLLKVGCNEGRYKLKQTIYYFPDDKQCISQLQYNTSNVKIPPRNKSPTKPVAAVQSVLL